jgi:hypothetical protein
MQATAFNIAASVTGSDTAAISLPDVIGIEKYLRKAPEGATPIDESRGPQCAHHGGRGGHLVNYLFK